MSTDLLRIKVLAKSGCDVTLRVRIVYGFDLDGQDNPAATAHQFFLLLLTNYDNTTSQQNEDLQADLNEQQEGGSLTELDFRQQVASRYISQVVRLESHNFPVITNPALNGKAAYESREEHYARCPYTDYRVTVTDARWIAHLQPGEEWGTVANVETDE